MSWLGQSWTYRPSARDSTWPGTTHRWLSRTVVSCQYSNGRIMGLDLADRTRRVMFWAAWRRADNDSGSVTAGLGASEFAASTLADIPTGNRPVHLLMANIEGLEARVFAAVPRTLQRIGTAMVEVNDRALANNRSTEQQLLVALSNAGLERVTELRRPLAALCSWLGPRHRHLLVTRS
jgi:hypothetical protein